MGRQETAGPTAVVLLLVAVLGMVQRNEVNATTVDQFQFENSIYTVAEDVGMATVYVLRIEPHDPTSPQVDVATSDGTATNGVDYISKTDTLSFLPTNNRVPFSVSIVDNTVDNSLSDIRCFTLSLTNPNPSSGQLGPNAQVCIRDNDNFFGGTCPPMEAVIESNGEPVIEVSVTSDSATAVVSWTDPTTTGMNMVYNCFPSMSAADTECMNGGAFPITTTIADNNGRIRVQYTVYESFFPTVVVHDCEFYLRVLDPIPPVISCPANVPVPAGDDFMNGTADWMVPEGTDNSGQVTTTGPMVTPPVVLNIGTHTFTYSAMDSSGNVASCSFNVSVTDLTDPVIECPANIITDTDSMERFATVMWYAPNVTDNSGETIEPLLSQPSGSQFEIGNHEVIVNATDSQGNTGNCSFTIEVQDNENPVIECPANLTVATNSSVDNVTLALPELASASDNSGSFSVSIDVAGDMYMIGDLITLDLATGQHFVQYTATDNYTNSEMCEMHINVTDDEAPMIMCPQNEMGTTDEGLRTGNISFGQATVSDNSMQTVNVTVNATSDSAFPIGETIVQFVATDESSNMNECFITITVTDDENPTIECPGDIEVDADMGENFATVDWFPPNVTDNSGESITPMLSHSSGDQFPFGPTVVIVNATDSHSNFASCNFTVNVLDNEPPIIMCPANQTNATDFRAADVTLPLPDAVSASDNSGQYNITIDVAGATYRVGDSVTLDLATGEHLLQYTIFDAAMNNDTCDMYITVIDTEDPQIICPSLGPVRTDPGLDTANVTFDPANVTDNSMLSITPVASPMSGSVFPIGDTPVQFNATDKSGNTASCMFTVTVQDMENPELNCTNFTYPTSPGLPSASIDFIEPTATDNVEVSVVNCFKDGSTVAAVLSVNIGTESVACVSRDTSSNSVSCEVFITVEDTESPNITCPANQNVSTDGGQDFATLTLPSLDSSVDNSGYFTVSVDVAGTQYNVGDSVMLSLAEGVHLVEYTATDNATNSEMCNMTVTVIDGESPNITCPANETVPTDGGQDFATYELPPLNASVDNSGYFTVSVDVAGMQYEIGDSVTLNLTEGVHLLQYTAIDNATNSEMCDVYVTVTDDENPMIECPGDIEVDADMGENFAIVDWFPPNVTDNSGESITPMLSHSSGDQFPFGPTVVIVNATDSHLNLALCNFTVNVLDNEPPTIMCPANQTNATDFRAADVTLPLPDPDSASDNSGQYNITIDVAGTTYRVGDSVTFDLATGEHLLQYTIFDAAMNNDTCDMYITVIDTEDPQIICPSLGPVRTDPGLDTANVTFDSANVTDNSMLSITPVASPMSGSIFSIGDTPVQFNATDKSGNTASCMFTVTVQDMENPELNCTNFTYPTSPGLPSASIDFIEPTATDNVEVSVVNCFKDGSGVGAVLSVDIGTESVNCVARDNSNNLVSCEFFITVEDTESPNITCPANRNVSTDGGQDFATLTLPSLDSSVDNSGYFTVSVDVAGTQYNVGDPVMLSLAEGVHLVEYTATDNATNSEMCNMTVTVIDGESPNITCPANETVPTDGGQDFATYELPPLNASVDNSGYFTVSVDVAGMQYKIGDSVTLNLTEGVHLLQYTATDNATNSEMCDVYVTVTDDENPTIECPGDIEVDADMGENFAIVDWFPPNVTDNSGESITPMLSHSSGDQFPFGPTVVIVNATDSHLNLALCNFTVNVLDNEPPTIMCPANQTNATDFRAADVTLPLPDPDSASDNSGQYNITIDVAGTTYRVGDSVTFDLATGEHLLQYTIFDAAMNNDTCDMYITVIDTEDPQITCPSLGPVRTDPGLDTANVTFDPANVTDNSMLSITPVADPMSGSIFSIGDTSVQFNATDDSGNTASCMFTVTVQDMENPELNCTNFTYPTSPGLPSASIDFIEPTATDNVEVSVVNCFKDGSGVGAVLSVDIGTESVNCVARDNSNNLVSCEFFITVEDTESPNITCPANRNVSTDGGQHFATLTLPSLDSSVDNSGYFTVSIDVAGTQYNVGDPVMLSLAEGVHLVEYTATDNATNSEMCNMTVTVIDDEPPIITCPSMADDNTHPGSPNGTVVFANATVTDNSGMSIELVANATSGVTLFPIGDTLVEFIATDNSGNSANCTFIVRILDMEAPSIECPDNIMVDTDPGQDYANVTWFPPNVTDNSGEDIMPTLSRDSGDRFDIGTVMVSVNAQDSSNNPNFCFFSVTVQDNEPPTIMCPANQTNSTDFRAADVTLPLPDAVSASDNAGQYNITIDVAGTTYRVGDSVTFDLATGEHLLQYIITDDAMNNDTCDAYIIVIDEEDPVLVCPGDDLLVVPDGQVNASITWSEPLVTDNSGDALMAVASQENGTMVPIGEVITIVYNATDSAGNVGYCNFTITVIDNVPPVITCPSNVSRPTAFNQSYGPVTWDQPTVTDNVPRTVTVTSDHVNGSNFDLGDTIVTLTATDAAMNNDTCQFKVTVIDEEKPVILNCPASFNITTISGQSYGIPNFTEPTAQDNSGSVTIAGLGRTGNQFPIGPHAIVYVAIDDANNNEVCRLTLLVIDEEKPTLQAPSQCPTDIVVFIQDMNSDNTTVMWTEPVFVDNSGMAPTVTVTPLTNNSPFPEGNTTVTIAAADTAGNTLECVFLVTVNVFDMTPPTLSPCPPWFAPVMTDPGSDTASPFDFGVAANDSGSGVESEVLSVSEPLAIGDNFVSLSARDFAGNVGYCNFTVTVTDAERPNITSCPGNDTVSTRLDSPYGFPTWMDPTAVDNSGSVMVNCSKQSGDAFDIGNTTVVCTAEDPSNNTDMCSFIITVEDNQSPTVTFCPGNINKQTDQGLATAITTFGQPTGADNDGIPIVPVGSHTNGSAFDLGVTQVSFSFMDSSGNVAYCNFTVTVVDGEPPTAGDTCPNDTMVFTPTGRPTSPVLWTPPTLTDNVGVVNTTNSHSSNDEFPIGITPVVYTATDAAGNVGRCEFMVEVQDTEDPVFDLCPLPIRQPTDPSEPFATVSWTVPNVTDNSNNIASMDASHQPGQTFPIGSHTVTYTAVDQDSNIGTCSFAVVVFDNENPVVENCQSNVTLYVPSNSTQLSASWPFPNATDNAGPPTVFNATYTEITVVSRSPVNVTIDWQVGFETVTLFHIGCYRSVIRVQDDAGNVVECITTVWIFDLIPPVFDVCPPVLDVSYPTDLNLPSAVVNWTPLSATDNTGGPVTLVRSHMSGQAFDIGVTTVTVNATDESGNLATCVFNITVVDEQQPNVTCPSDFEVYTNPQSNVSTGRWSLPSDAFDNSNFYMESSSRDPADPLGVGNHHVSYNVTDRAGNQASCNFYITVRDNENPYFEPCPVSFSSPTDPQESTANVTWLPVIAMDNVGVQEFNSSHQPGDLFQIGDTLVTYNVTDTSGNQGSCSFVVTVEDTQPPSITCPGPAIITNTDPDQNVANVTFTAAAADNSGEWTLSCTPPSGSNFSIGADSVMCVATDPSNNPASCFFAVVVSDNQEPVFQNCPSNVILNEPLESFFDNFTIAVNWTPPVVTDNVGVVQLDVTNEPGSVFGIGSHSVTYTARDEANNMATCQFNVIVNDVQPPVITGCPMNLPRFPTDPGLNISRATWMEPQASDNSGTVTLTSNYVRGDAFSVGNTTVVYTALDDSGNSVNCSFVIQVYDNQPPEFTGCPIQGVTNDTSLRSDRGVAWWTAPQPTDNVDVASVQSDYQPGSSFPLGPTVVTYNATDTAGLMAQCSFTVLIQDNEMPVIECPAQVSVSTFTHQGGTNVTYPTVNATDYASGLSTLSCSMNSGAYFPIGSNNVICTAEDRANNMRVCIFAVIVVGMDDNVPPVISNCPANMTHPADNSSTATIVSWTPPTASDNSGDPVNLMMSAAPGSAFEIGVTVVTYTATDGVGLISTCIFSITILDLSSPVILQCPGNITQPTDPSMDSAVVDWASPGAVDNSGTVTLMASTTPGSEFPIGVTTVVYTATDLDNNVERCSFQINITDEEDPVITGCPSVQLERETETGQNYSLVMWDEITVHDNSGNWTVDTSGPSQGRISVGVHQVSYVATDLSGNLAECSFSIRVSDTELPQFTNCPTAIIKLVNQSGLSAVVTWDPLVITDNVGVDLATLMGSHNSGDTFTFGGPTTVMYNVTDVSGNTNICRFTVTVSDAPAALSNCPVYIQRPTDPGQASAVVTWDSPDVEPVGASVDISSTPYASGDTIPLGRYNITHQATVNRDFLNIQECFFVVEVIDNEPPTWIVCPTGESVTPSAGSDTAPVFWAQPEAQDNSGSVNVSPGSHVNGSQFPVGLTTVTYNASDDAGHVITCSFVVTVQDVLKPNVTCPDSFSLNTDPNKGTATMTWMDAQASDNVAVTSLVSSPANGSPLPVGLNTITYTATDAAQNTITCSFNITVIDNEPPRFSNCPAMASAVAATDQDMATVTWDLPSASDNAITVTVEASHSSAVLYPLGVTPVVYLATDGSGNRANCTFDVTVTDAQDPVFTNCPGNLSANTAMDQAIATGVIWTPPTASDNDPLLQTTNNYDPPANFSIGVHIVNYTAVDRANNKATCIFTVTVTDMQDPVYTGCPASFSIPAQVGTTMANVSWVEPSASDNVAVNSSVSNVSPNTIFDFGVTTVEYTAQDQAGNIGKCTFNVTVLDSTAPMLVNCPSDQVFCANLGTLSRNVSWNEPTATDNEGAVTLVSDHTPGSTFNHNDGTPTPVTYTATDESGLQASCTFNVIIRDCEDPVFTDCPSGFVEQGDSGGSSTSVQWTEPTATDNSGQVDVNRTHIPGSIFTVDTSPVFVQYTAVDRSGNSNTCTFTVVVTDNTPPVIRNCPSNNTISTDSNSNTGSASWTPPTVDSTPTDPVTLIPSHEPGASFPIGTHSVTYTARDANGNEATCIFWITVRDGQNPTLTNCPESFTLTVAQAADQVIADWTPPTASDNSGSVTLTMTFEPGQLLGPGQYPVVYTAMDSAGLTATCMFTVTIQIGIGCNPSPCNNGGTCTPVGSDGFTCSCTRFWMGTTCDEDVNECTSTSVIAECSARGLVCVNKLDPVGYSCECPNGFVRVGNTDNCRQGRRFRIVIFIIEINGIVAVFVTDLNNRNSVIFLIRQRDLEALFDQVFGGLPGFGNSVVLFFGTGSIAVNALITFDPDSTVTQTDVNNALQQAINSNDLLMGSIYKVTPSASQVIEEVCLDGYCQNGGTCVPDTVTFLSSCTCHSGYVGNRCESEVIDVNNCTSTSVIAECSARGLVCVNKLDPVGYSCECPNGFVRVGNTDNCRQGRRFRIVLVIVEINETTAVFLTILNNRNSVIFLTRQRDLEDLFNQAFGGLPGFSNSIVLSFNSGSIVVNALITFDLDSTVTQTDVNNALQQAIDSNDLLMGSIYKVTPSASQVIEEVCLDGYCQNGGTCVPDTVTFLSSCICPSGYVGNRCESGDVTTTPPPSGDGLSTEVIIAIAVGTALALLLLLLIVFCLCFLMKQERKRVTTGYLYAEDHEGQRGPTQYNGSLYDVQFGPKDNNGFLRTPSQFSVPYVASGAIPLHRLRERNDADYY